VAGSHYEGVSSLTAAPDRRFPRIPATAWIRAGRRWLGADRALGLTLAAGLAAVGFLTSGGVDLGPNTWVEIVLTFVGAALVSGALLLAAPVPGWGGTALLLMAAVTAFTMLSISWSVQPADSWIEANRAVSYLAVFGGAIALGRLFPARWSAVVGAMATVAVVLCGYALLVKVFPATLDPNEILGRLRAPLDYWNAVGLMAALGLPALLWAGTRRESSGVLRALTVPAIGVLVTALVLSYSRGALLVTILGLALWFAVVPLRLRGALLLAPGVAGGAVATIWAIATHPLTRDQASLASRTTAGHAFGLALVLMLVVLTALGFAAAYAMDRVQLGAELRRRAGIGLLVLVACAPAAGVVGLAASSRGFTGEVSYLWNKVTSTKGGVGDNAGRLVQVSNSRARYWSEGFKVGRHALLKGVGASGYATARTRYSSDKLIARHAHSYVVETFADFGLIGVGLSFGLFLAWAAAAARAVGFGAAQARAAWDRVRHSRLLARAGVPALEAEPRAPLSPDRLAERNGLITLLVLVVMFGASSAIDWTWFVPGVAIPALVCAGWLAGRGPLERPVGARPASAAPRPRWHQIFTEAPGRSGATALLAAIALICAWTIWQPLRSSQADSTALAELSRGHGDAALADAERAVSRNSVSAEALWDLSAVYGGLGRPEAARQALIRAVRLQPANAATWLQLGEYDLQFGRRREALAVLNAALYLDPHSPEALSAAYQARSVPVRPASRAKKHTRSR
jgi:hypothetical protein